MRILVVFGSKNGGTREIAVAVGEELAAAHAVDVWSAQDASAPVGYDAVVLAGSLYAWHWGGGLAQWVRRYQETLSQLSVVALSSGPTDDSASTRELPPPQAVQRLLDRVGCRQHRTFGGRVAPDSDAAKRGLPVGDWRNFDDIRAWARELSAAFEAIPAAPADLEYTTRQWVRRSLLGLTGFTGVTATLGGAMLIASRHGSEVTPPSILDGTPFGTFLVPGLLLFACVGLLNGVAAVMTLRRSLWYEPTALAAGIALLVWIGVQMTMIEFSPFQLAYLGIGALTAAIAAGLWLTRPVPPDRIAERTTALRNRAVSAVG